jgi:glucosamine--fructose-6-phosphate aminotransferase (isomerizing)
MIRREGLRNRFQKPISSWRFADRRILLGSTVTHFLQDILRQPAELERTIEYLRGAGQRPLAEAARAVQKARHIYLTGIGSSWHAALTAAPLFSLGGCPVYAQDASELLQFATIPANAVIIAISRTGRSVEIVRLLTKASECGAVVIAVTNSENGPLAQQAQIPIVVRAPLDHGISVNTYSTLAAATGALASATVGTFNDALADLVLLGVAETGRLLAAWQEQIAESSWLLPGSVCYFLGRGSSLGSCHEARLLWEEGVKSPATAMGTGAFRHGPQEMVAKGSRFGIWIDAWRMRAPDLAVARDLKRLGASVMVIGQDLTGDAGDLVFRLPEMPAEWQFLIDVIPAQLAAERLAHRSGVDCDSFRLCSYIVEDEWGLLHENVQAGKDQEIVFSKEAAINKLDK